MKKALQLKAVSVKKYPGTVWFVHTLVDGSGTYYTHWNKSENLIAGMGERVVMKTGIRKAGKPVLRMVNIIPA